MDARSFKRQMPVTRRTVLLLALGAFGIVFLLWQADSFILFPLRLIVTYVHEIGHGLAAILTGGEFISFHVFGNGAGLALTDGGNRLVILPAGYLSTALFGALLLYAANRMNRVRFVAVGLGLFLIGSALIFGARGPEEVVTVVTALFASMVGLVFGVALMAIGFYGSRAVIVFTLNLLAFIVGFSVISDFLFLFAEQSASIGDIPNDAAAMARLTNMSTYSWIVIWAVLSVLMMGVAAILAFVEPAKKKTQAALPPPVMVERIAPGTESVAAVPTPGVPALDEPDFDEILRRAPK